MSEGTQRRLAAIVSADVVGYSRLMGVDEAGTHERLQALFADLVQPKIIEHRGRVVKLMGDGLLAEFPSVIDAVNWALEVQAKVAELDNETAADERIEYRVGVNLGDIIVDGDDIFGDGVNVAARLQEIAQTGGVCISDKVHIEVRGKIGVEFTDGGAQAVKNITEPVHVWRWSPNQQATAMPVVAGQAKPLPLPDKPSIAVLPFDNMSGDPEQEYFADGIAEDIITALSRFHAFLVIARNSTFTYKGRAVNVGDVGRELGVRYVVEGSIRKAGNRVRVTAQLIEAAGGNHIWAERYDRDLEDIFALQDEITETIVGAVEQEIGSVERTRATQKRPDSLEAWELLQRGLHHVWQMDRNGL
jgi:adenylate cyclase